MVSVKPNLMSLLKEKGITQMELSKMSGVPQGSISRFDKNSRHEDEHVFSIARALNVPINKLFLVDEKDWHYDNLKNPNETIIPLFDKDKFLVWLEIFKSGLSHETTMKINNIEMAVKNGDFDNIK